VVVAVVDMALTDGGSVCVADTDTDAFVLDHGEEKVGVGRSVCDRDVVIQRHAAPTMRWLTADVVIEMDVETLNERLCDAETLTNVDAVLLLEFF
jgi:hypothetical protein